MTAIALASQLATHVALFHHGRVQTGTATELLQHDVLEHVFGIELAS